MCFTILQMLTDFLQLKPYGGNFFIKIYDKQHEKMMNKIIKNENIELIMMIIYQ